MTTQPVTIGDANLAELRYEEETDWGTVDSGATFTDIPFTSETLGQDTETIESELINSSRRTEDVIVTGVSASGDVVTELMCEAFDDWWEALLMATYGTEATDASVGVDITVSSEHTVFTRSSGDWTTNFTVGDWVKVTNATLTENNGFRKVSAVTSLVLTLAGATGTADAGETVTVLRLAAVTDGNTFRSYSIEREHTDLANTFEILAGMVLNACSLALNNRAKLGATFSFVGKTEANASATSGDGSPTAYPDNKVLSTASDTTLFMEGGAGSDHLVNLSLSFDNGIYPQSVQGTISPIGQGKGAKSLTGSYEGYFELTAGQAIMNKYRNRTETAVAVVLTDNDGNAIIVDVPRILYTNARSNAGGKGQPMMVTADWQASEATEGSANLLWRIAKYSA